MSFGSGEVDWFIVQTVAIMLGSILGVLSVFWYVFLNAQKFWEIFLDFLFEK